MASTTANEAIDIDLEESIFISIATEDADMVVEQFKWADYDVAAIVSKQDHTQYA